MFHREPFPFRLAAPRFFRLARLLPFYDGAVSQALARDRATQERVAEQAPPAAASSGAGVEELPDITSIVGLSQQPGFPSIAYTSGG